MANDTKQQPGDDEPVAFSVMPHGDNGDLVSHPGSPAPRQELPQDDGGDEGGNDGDQPAEHHGLWSRKATYVVLGILVLGALGAGAYFMVGSGGKEPAAPATRLSTMFLQQYFGSPTCNDQGRCGDTADPDSDGLENWDELKEQTDPTMNDTDGDGLADGDEVLIYLTDPISEYTDARPASKAAGYTDGSQVKNDYDPLTPGLKMTETRKSQIALDTGKYKLHEPTVTTLATPSAPQPKTVNVFIANGKFDAAETTIKVNDSVTWINRDTASHQIASDPHPAHTALPELESGSLATTQTFTFKFTKAGTFAYHDHLNPGIKGKIIVE